MTTILPQHYTNLLEAAGVTQGSHTDPYTTANGNPLLFRHTSPDPDEDKINGANTTVIKHRFRGTPTRGGQSSPVLVDRETAVIRNVSVFQSGVEALGHGIIGDAITLGMLAELGNSRSLGHKSRLGHPGLSEDGTAKQIGRMRNFRINNDKVVADLHLLESARMSPKFDGDVVEWLLSYAEEAPEDFGMSVVIYADAVWRRENGEEVSAYEVDRPEDAVNEFPLIRPVELSAVDIVDEPAANRDGLFSSLNDGRYSARWAADMFSEIDDWIATTGVSHEKAYQFAMRYFAARGINSSPAGGGRKSEEIMAAHNHLAPAAPDALKKIGVEDEALLSAETVEDVDFDEVEDEEETEELGDERTGASELQQLAEMLQIGEIVSLISDVSARQEQQEGIVAQLAAAVEQLSTSLADAQRGLALANGFPVVTQDASLPYENTLQRLLGKSNGVAKTAEIDNERLAAPSERVTKNHPLDSLNLEELLGRATSRQSEEARVANSLLGHWNNGG